ncbi:hypothetical protein D3C84_1288760 [compost metagenome]
MITLGGAGVGPEEVENSAIAERNGVTLELNPDLLRESQNVLLELMGLRLAG